mmetsp:Transcript_69351/g.80959  ORF Transcript_69351/g.80959 Transcript_69351/m.80959 type:complete len:84 (-) Transcript_69351:160-411(-)
MDGASAWYLGGGGGSTEVEPAGAAPPVWSSGSVTETVEAELGGGTKGFASARRPLEDALDCAVEAAEDTLWLESVDVMLEATD